MRTLSEEIGIGVKIMNNTVVTIENGDYNKITPVLLPNKTWNGVETINDTVMIRIINTSYGDYGYKWHPTKVRSHCKNYFEYLRSNFENYINIYLEKRNKLSREGKMKYLSDFVKSTRGFIDDSEEVLAMLKVIENNLDDNARNKFPR